MDVLVAADALLGKSQIRGLAGSGSKSRKMELRSPAVAVSTGKIFMPALQGEIQVGMIKTIRILPLPGKSADQGKFLAVVVRMAARATDSLSLEQVGVEPLSRIQLRRDLLVTGEAAPRQALPRVALLAAGETGEAGDSGMRFCQISR